MTYDARGYQLAYNAFLKHEADQDGEVVFDDFFAGYKANSKEFVDAVVEFNKEILGIAQRTPVGLSAEEEAISSKCLSEELEEFMQATTTCDLVGQVDALVDLMYFAVGVMYKLGLTPQQIHDCCMAVHVANMSKKKGINAKRATGAADATKPEGWVPPEEALRKIIYGL